MDFKIYSGEFKMINSWIRKLGYCFIKLEVGKTRASTSFAKDYFKDKRIDVVEIGVYEGTNANNIIEELNINKIYLIDPYISGAYKEKEIVRAEKKAHKLLDKDERVIWIKDFSKNVFNKVGEPDFIYIDGDHNYNYFKDDIEDYYEVLKEGGILAGDDLDTLDVSRAFWEFVIKNEIDMKNVYYSKYDWWIVKEIKGDDGDDRRIFVRGF